MDLPQVCVEEFTSSELNHDSSLVIRFGTIRIRISILEKNLASSVNIRTQYLQYLKVVGGDRDPQPQDATEDDFYDWILIGCDRHFLKLTSHAIPPKPTLHDFYNRKIYHLALYATPDDKFTLKDDQDNVSEFHSNHLDVFERLGHLWPFLEPCEVTICASSVEAAFSQRPREVVTDAGGRYFFKHNFVPRELETYAKIKQANLEQSRISRLCGLVGERPGRIVGLLLEHIGCGSVTLSRALERHTSLQLRNKWIEQVTTTLMELHTSGIVWGDAKADNVLIDGENNAWIIDFGGGYTRGWVDEKLANSIDGDQQGLSRIVTHVLST
ncbi:hypothetical protein WHR41_09279 [Cladosporium halotolerans]|uniref:Protein kinase domain-containing protein n=1 Tax=Cladosporium halotolerans TaxID=1052096 RepID=A0AB34KB27_9PEZI